MIGEGEPYGGSRADDEGTGDGARIGPRIGPSAGSGGAGSSALRRAQESQAQEGQDQGRRAQGGLFWREAQRADTWVRPYRGRRAGSVDERARGGHVGPPLPIRTGQGGQGWGTQPPQVPVSGYGAGSSQALRPFDELRAGSPLSRQGKGGEEAGAGQACRRRRRVTLTPRIEYGAGSSTLRRAQESQAQGRLRPLLSRERGKRRGQGGPRVILRSAAREESRAFG